MFESCRAHSRVPFSAFAVKTGAEQAAAKAKEGVHDVQLKRELGETYHELGKLACELVDRDAISHERLTPLVKKVRDLTAQLEEHAPEAKVEEEEPQAASGPPAMPS